MADLTSTLTISGTVNGKKISFTHVYTMSDVYDVGVHDLESFSSNPGVYTGDTAGGTAITFVQDTPTYFIVSNKDTHGVTKVINGTVDVYLAPGSFLCTTGTLGLMLSTTSDTSITLDDVGSVTIEPVLPFPTGRVQIFAGFNAVS